MCEISAKLKLCTCKTEAVEALKHYWILSKPDEHGITTIGLILPPAFIGEEVEKLNIKTLTDLLNSGHCFDIT